MTCSTSRPNGSIPVFWLDAIVVDFISSMTEASAIEVYRRMTGKIRASISDPTEEVGVVDVRGRQVGERAAAALVT